MYQRPSFISHPIRLSCWSPRWWPWSAYAPKKESIAKGMIELAERCPGLRSVCVSNCSHLTDQVLWLGSLNIIIRKWLNHSHNLHCIRNQNQIEIVRASWRWPPTAPVWWHSSAPDSHISPMLAFRWDRRIIIIFLLLKRFGCALSSLS